METCKLFLWSVALVIVTGLVLLMFGWIIGQLLYLLLPLSDAGLSELQLTGIGTIVLIASAVLSEAAKKMFKHKPSEEETT